MSSSASLSSPRRLRRVLILADESANWKIAGLRQLDRVAFSLNEYAQSRGQSEPVSVCVFWASHVNGNRLPLPNDSRLGHLQLTDSAEDFLADASAIDLVVSTRVFLYRESIADFLSNVSAPGNVQANGAGVWESHAQKLHRSLPATLNGNGKAPPWNYLSESRQIAGCERAFLRYAGKSQDGLVSRHLNRPVSRWLSRWLLKLPLAPSTWSLLIFALPMVAALSFVEGTYLGFVLGAAIFQLYSILDGCDGEIARAKFLQTEFGRRLDSLCDLIGNILLALSLGLGLARQQLATGSNEWLYLLEGIAAATLIVTSEGIVFARRSRSEAATTPAARWNGALYKRQQEFLERSGILFLGEKFAWWLVQLTKRDMAMLAFFAFALIGQPAWILHLLLLVSAISSALAGNAFLRQPAPALPQEAS